MFNAELRNGVALATDAAFVSGLIADTTPTASSNDFLEDVTTILAAIDGSAGSRYFLIAQPVVVKVLAVTASAVGGRAFAELGVTGGVVGGIVVIASDALQDGQLLMFDATQIAADGGIVRLDASRHATLDLAGGASPTYSLFQRNASALRAERLFGFKLLRATAAASITGAAYIGTSP
jgi:hypothetical protein